ncbi:MAG: hypothetical protein ACE5IB_07025 [Candidatus Geothermarchaeales archaeon]
MTEEETEQAERDPVLDIFLTVFAIVLLPFYYFFKIIMGAGGSKRQRKKAT